MADNLTKDQRKWVLKQYWKTENAEKFRQKWAEEIDTPPPSRQFIEYAINLMKLDPSGILQKVVDRSLLPPRKIKC